MIAHFASSTTFEAGESNEVVAHDEADSEAVSVHAHGLSRQDQIS